MGPQSKPLQATARFGNGFVTTAPVGRCAEAFAYDDDVNAEVVARIQAEANEDLGDLSDWVVVDGFAGAK